MKTWNAQIQGVLRSYLSDILSRSILSLSLNKAKIDLSRRRPGDGERLLKEIASGVRTYVAEEDAQKECIEKLAEVLGVGQVVEESPLPEAFNKESSGEAEPASDTWARSNKREHVIRIAVERESDIVEARGTGRELARSLGFSPATQIKLATAISELARNIIQYAGSGSIRIRRLEGRRLGLEIVAKDEGPGISNIDLVMSERYRSKTGMGVGLKGTKRMMDEFDLESEVGRGTRVMLRKYVA